MKGWDWAPSILCTLLRHNHTSEESIVNNILAVNAKFIPLNPVFLRGLPSTGDIADYNAHSYIPRSLLGRIA